MTVREAAERCGLSIVCGEGERDISSVYCCDLLSVVMGRAPADSAWVTVIGNVNTIAVATLADVACIVLAEGFSFDADALRAAEGKVTLLTSERPVYETACGIGALL